MRKLFMAIAAVYLILILAYAFFGPTLLQVDMALSQGIFSSFLPYITFFNILTNLGTAVFLFVIATLLFFTGNRRSGALLFLVIWVDLAINLLLKNIFGRGRPSYFRDDLWSLESNGPSLSFPSGHAERSFIAATILTRFFPKNKLPLYLFAALIAFSRIAIGAHYLLDVIVGTLNGIVIGYFWLNLPWDKIKQKIEPILKLVQLSDHKQKK